MEPFASSHLKIERANKHIADVGKIIGALANGYIATIETHPQTGRQAIKHGHPKMEAIGIEIAIVAGDAIHNLRTALDYSWIATIQKLLPAALDDFSKFPFRKTREGVEDALKGREIDTLCPRLYERILSDIKPYAGGNDYILALHTLDITDKHLLLIPMITIAGVSGIAFKNKETGETVRGATWVTTRPGPYTIDLPEGNWHIEDKGKLAVAVAFRDFAGLQGLEVLDTLKSLIQLVRYTVNVLENI